MPRTPPHPALPAWGRGGQAAGADPGAAPALPAPRCPAPPLTLPCWGGGREGKQLVLAALTSGALPTVAPISWHDVANLLAEIARGQWLGAVRSLQRTRKQSPPRHAIVEPPQGAKKMGNVDVRLISVKKENYSKIQNGGPLVTTLGIQAEPERVFC
ncbi:hypothetical protein H4582DRAFT_2064921 [Lactarius indigo]|nr:hypothetical protein H4582DRAFT_2064921 [Lactarius indigo]